MKIIDKSGVISKTGSPQVLLKENDLRKGFFIQNVSPSHPIWINDMGKASSVDAGSIRIDPSMIISTLNSFPSSSNEISILGHEGSNFSCREW